MLWRDARELLVLWAVVGIGGIVANIVVSLQADRMAHRRRLGAMATFFEHVLVLPFAFHSAQHSGRLLKVMLTGVDHLFGIWLSFFRENLATFVALFIMLPLSLFMNWRLGLLLIVLILFFAVANAWVVSRTDRLQQQVEDLPQRARQPGRRRAGQHPPDPELRAAGARNRRDAPHHPPDPGGAVSGAELVGAALGADARRLDHHRDPDLRARHLALHQGRGDASARS